MLIKKGFTLIELLVVIAIIAILAAILFPVFAQAKMAAKKAADLSNMKQLGTAVTIYINDYDDVMPTATGFDQHAALTGDASWTYGKMTRWSSQLVVGAYVKSTEMFRCPIDPSYKPDYTISGGYWSWAAPSPTTRTAAPMSYMLNALNNSSIVGGNEYNFPTGITDFTGAVDPGGYYDSIDTTTHMTTYAPVTLTQSTSPATLILMTNGQKEMATWAGGSSLATLYTTETIPWIYSDLTYGWDAVVLSLGSWYGSADTNLNKAWRKFSNGSNFVFTDGHAKSMQPGALLYSATQLNPKYWLLNSTGY